MGSIADILSDVQSVDLTESTITTLLAWLGGLLTGSAAG